VRTLSRFTATQVSLKWHTSQSAEEIIMALDVQRFPAEPVDVTITEKTVTRLTSKPQTEDYTSEVLETSIRYPSAGKYPLK
jgi:hypothetical protein